MLETRTTDDQGEIFPVPTAWKKFNPFDKPWPGNPPDIVFRSDSSYVTSDCINSYEAMTPNSSASREWKSFTHYIRAYDLPRPSGQSMLPICSDLWSPWYGSDVWWQYYVHDFRDIHPSSRRLLWRTSESTIQTVFDPWSAHPTMFDPNPIIAGEYINPPDEIQDYLQRALKTMWPAVKPRLSIPNTLYELKDFRSLPRTLNGIAQFGLKGAGKQRLKNIATASYRRQLSRSARGIVRSAGRNTREGVRTVSDAYLQKEFNVGPLLSDIAGLFLGVQRVADEMYKLLYDAERPQKRYFRYTFDEFKPESTLYYNYNPIEGQNWPWYGSYCTTESAYKQSVFNAEMRFSYYYSAFRIEYARVLSLLDSIGVNLNPAIIWNAIPWSFVIDWVIGVSRWLDQFKIRAFEPVVNILGFCWSIKRERWIRSHYEVGQNWHRLHHQVVQMPDVREVAYRRHVGFPALSSFTTSGISLHELVLGAALGLTRRRKHRKKVRY